jgi:hypothetical protein
MPYLGREWPPSALVTHGLRIGKKCIVTLQPSDQGWWLEAGGSVPASPRCLESIEEEEEEEEENTPRTTNKGVQMPSSGQGSVDPDQARVYSLFNEDCSVSEVSVILPDDVPFRGSKKGRVSERSKSFDDAGNPVHEVMLLYALKTGCRDDRERAMEAIPMEFWGDMPLGEVLQRTHKIAESKPLFENFVGGKLAKSAAIRGGLELWEIQEKVADRAVASSSAFNIAAKGKYSNETHFRFVQAVKNAAAIHSGLPAQSHVREAWKKLRGTQDDKELRKTLGFEWLPSLSEWTLEWGLRFKD